MTTVLSGADDVERRFLEQEHREIARGANRISEVAGLVGTVNAADLSYAMRTLLDWLERSLEPHAAWEEKWFYPTLTARLGTEWPAKLMRYEHDQIRRAVETLEADRALLRHEPAHETVLQIRSHLYGLHCQIHAHVEREDRFLLPLLDEAAEPTVPTATV